MKDSKQWIVTAGVLALALAATVAMAQAATPAKGKATAETPKANATPGTCDGQGPHGPMGMGMGHGGPMGGPGMECGGGKGAGKGAGCCGRGGHGGPGMGAGRGHMGGGPGMGRGPMGHGPGMGGPLAMLARLDLTDAQKEKVAAIHERVQRQSIQTRADLELARLDLQKLMHAERPDSRAIDAQIDRIAALRATQQKAHAAAMVEVHGLLTPEQLKKLKDLGGPGGHPGMGPGGMGHGRGMGMGMGWDPQDDGPGDDGSEG